jgi:hypothetical protein
MKKLIILAGLALAAQLPASLVINLDQSTITGAPGDTITFIGSIANINANELVIDGAALYTSLDLSGDTTPFFLNVLPHLTSNISLLPGTFTPSIPLFDILVPAGTLPGTYFLGNSFDLLGGLVAGDQQPLGNTNFTVEVSSVPEPATYWLMGVALATLGWRARR